MQALLLEETERERGTLVDLDTAPPKPGALHAFIGTSHIFGPWEPVTPRQTPPIITAANEPYLAHTGSSRANASSPRQW
jgi:hypothetical protein